MTDAHEPPQDRNEEQFENRTLSLTLEVGRWLLSVHDSIDDSHVNIGAEGYLTVREDSRTPRVFFEPNVSIEEIPCKLLLHLRDLKSAEAVEPIEVPEDDKWSMILTPTKPMGILSYFPDNDGSEFGQVEACVECNVAILPEHLTDLKARKLSERPMPSSVHLILPRVPGRRQGELGWNFLIDKVSSGHVVTQASWNFNPSRAGSRWSRDARERLILRRVDAFIGELSWEYEGWMRAHHQFNIVAGELLASAVEHMHAGNVAPEDSGDWLSHAWSIATDLYETLLSAEHRTRKAGRDLKSLKKDDKDTPVCFPWRKRQLSQVFNLGLDSRDWSSICEDDGIGDVIDQYLGSGLDSPLLEWICTDILVYAEVREFGESIKQKAPVSLMNPLGMNFQYYSSAGNVERMMVKGFGKAFAWWIAKMAVWVGIPGYYGYTYWQRGYTEEVMIGVIGWLFLTLAWPKVKGSLGIGAQTEQRLKNLEDRTELLSKMAKAYMTVDPSQPPGVIRRALERTAGTGAVWGAQAYALVAKCPSGDIASRMNRLAGVAGIAS